MALEIPSNRPARRPGPPVAPVRFPLALGDCLKAVAGRQICTSPGLWAASGEAALEIAFEGIRDLGDGAPAQVVVPDFICPSVPNAVRAAGFEPRLCALDPRTWFYRPQVLRQVLGAETAAVVVVSYFGFLPRIQPECQALLAGVPVVEDLAQSYGTDAAPLTPRTLFRVYSFARGKSLPLAWGGRVDAVGEAPRSWMVSQGRRRDSQRRDTGSVLASCVNLTLSQVQSLVLHPWIWRFVPIPDRLVASAELKPRRGVPTWPVTRYAEEARALQREIAVRGRNARRIASRIADLPGLDFPRDEEAFTLGVALRFPLIFEQATIADTVRERLAAERVLKGPNDFDDYIGPTANAASIARRLLTLPTYSGSERAQDAAVEILRQVLVGSPGDA